MTGPGEQDMPEEQSESDSGSEPSGVSGIEPARTNSPFRTGEKKESAFSNVFQAFVAWTFLLAVVATFIILVSMKVSF